MSLFSFLVFDVFFIIYGKLSKISGKNLANFARIRQIKNLQLFSSFKFYQSLPNFIKESKILTKIGKFYLIFLKIEKFLPNLSEFSILISHSQQNFTTNFLENFFNNKILLHNFGKINTI